jgi:hypothetical protein
MQSLQHLYSQLSLLKLEQTMEDFEAEQCLFDLLTTLSNTP